MSNRDIETRVNARDDAGDWSELDVTPEEYATLKAAGIKMVRARRDRIKARLHGEDPYEFIDKIFRMSPERQEELRRKAIDEKAYLNARLEELGQRRARVLADFDQEIGLCADRLKEMEITIGVLDEVIQDETVDERKPISELSDDDVPFDEGFADYLWARGDATYFENAEAVNARDRELDALWSRMAGGPVY